MHGWRSDDLSWWILDFDSARGSGIDGRRWLESEEGAAALHDLGVELAQGYLFGRPEPLA